MMIKMLNIFCRFEPLYRFTNLYQLEKKHIHEGVLTIADEVFDEKKEVLEKLSKDNTEAVIDNIDGLKRKPKSFIKTLFDPKNALSEGEIKDEINTLIAAVS